MAESQKRLQRAEEENRVLDRPLVMPTEVENGVSVPLGNLFVRPPRGINDVSDNEPRDAIFYTYLPRPGSTAAPFSKMELAFGPKNKEQDFAEVVFGYFQRLGPLERTQRPIQSLGRTVQFDVAEVKLDRGAVASVNVPRGVSRSVALVYYILPNQKPIAQRTIQSSLETFACDGDVLKQHIAYQQGLRWSGLR
jgi:hypothetical protein